jgi:hypothetical protein
MTPPPSIPSELRPRAKPVAWDSTTPGDNEALAGERGGVTKGLTPILTTALGSSGGRGRPTTTAALKWAMAQRKSRRTGTSARAAATVEEEEEEKEDDPLSGL